MGYIGISINNAIYRCINWPILYICCCFIFSWPILFLVRNKVAITTVNFIPTQHRLTLICNNSRTENVIIRHILFFAIKINARKNLCTSLRTPFVKFGVISHHQFSSSKQIVRDGAYFLSRYFYYYFFRPLMRVPIHYRLDFSKEQKTCEEFGNSGPSDMLQCICNCYAKMQNHSSSVVSCTVDGKSANCFSKTAM